MNASEVAYRAAVIMSERGLCKGRLADREGRVCFNGAICAALTGDAEGLFEDDEYQVFLAITDEACRLLMASGTWAAPVFFNNDPRTSGEDVILLLKRIGKELECTPQK